MHQAHIEPKFTTRDSRKATVAMTTEHGLDFLGLKMSGLKVRFRRSRLCYQSVNDEKTRVHDGGRQQR